MSGVQSASTFIIIIPMIFWSLGGTTIYFSGKSGVGGVSFPTNSISLNDPIIKAWGYRMVVYFIEILDLKFLFFSRLTKF